MVLSNNNTSWESKIQWLKSPADQTIQAYLRVHKLKQTFQNSPHFQWHRLNSRVVIQKRSDVTTPCHATQKRASQFQIRSFFWGGIPDQTLTPSQGDCAGPRIMTLKQRMFSSEGDALIPGAARTNKPSQIIQQAETKPALK